MNEEFLNWEYDEERDSISTKYNALLLTSSSDLQIKANKKFTAQAEYMAFNKLKALKETGGCKSAIDELRTLILMHNLGMVYKIAIIYKDNGKLSLDELISEGLFVLSKTIDGFNPEFNLRFITYAYRSICRQMLRAIKQSTPEGTVVHQAVDFFDQMAKHSVDMDESARQNDVKNQLADLFKILREEDQRLLYEYYGIDNQTGIRNDKNRRRVHRILRRLRIHIRQKLIEKCI